MAIVSPLPLAFLSVAQVIIRPVAQQSQPPPPPPPALTTNAFLSVLVGATRSKRFGASAGIVLLLLAVLAFSLSTNRIKASKAPWLSPHLFSSYHRRSHHHRARCTMLQSGMQYLDCHLGRVVMNHHPSHSFRSPYPFRPTYMHRKRQYASTAPLQSGRELAHQLLARVGSAERHYARPHRIHPRGGWW